MLKVSVAMATYNGEHYLKKQIDSILCQLNNGDELIISYDKSKDNTYRILADYVEKDPRIKVFINEGKSGVFCNFQNALSKCSGDIIFISDQDDIWNENKILRIKEILIKGPYNMVIHNGVHIDANEKVISDSFFSMYGINDNKIRNFLKPRYSGCCTAFKKELLNKMLPIPTDVGAYDHWVGSIGEYFGKVLFLDEILIYHRLHDSNVTPKTHRSVGVVIRARWNLAINLIRRSRI